MLELMLWHLENTSQDSLVKHSCDSKAWKHIMRSIPLLQHDQRMCLVANGVNPFKLTWSNWSTWLVMLLNYNLPPWLTTNKFFIMFGLLIIGKESVTGENFDVYLHPLVDELQELWVYDVQKPLGYRSFTLRGVLLWTIHDFPGYGIIARVEHQGFAACLICGPKLRGEHSMELGNKHTLE